MVSSACNLGVEEKPLAGRSVIAFDEGDRSLNR